MVPVSVIFTRSPHKIASGVVSIATNCRWSHCGFVFGDAVVEATPIYGVRVSPLGLFCDREIVRFDADEGAAMDVVMREIGKPYDMIGAIGVGFCRQWERAASWSCGELVAYGLFSAGCRPVRLVESCRVTPRDLWLSTAIT